MPDRKNDILKRLIESDLTRSGGVYNPPSAEAAVGDLRGYLGQSQPLVPDDFGGRVPQTPAAPQVQPDFSVPDRTSHGRSRSAPLNPPSFGEVAAPLREAVSPVVDAFTPTAPTGRGRQRPAPPEMTDAGIPMPPPPAPGEAQAGLSFAGISPVEGPAPRADIAFDPSAPQTPQQRAQAGLAAAGMGEDPGYDPMSPELIDPETGERSDEARKLGLLERMFGEKGSDKYKNAGKGLMMAGAAIMSSSGDLGQAIGEGIQAGLMTYDDAMAALREEELEATKMGMMEEAHAMNMHLKSIQAARMSAVGGGGKSGTVKPEPEFTDFQKTAMLADEFLQLGLPADQALTGAINLNYGVPATLLRQPAGNDLDAFLNQ